ncbi:ATP-binding protein [Desulfovibrio sp. JC022]|uniref:PAS domain-containing hybrid sensor histidine kinase/response regulator n=1 Tax=Desulfovibrio sp. JC022 TaxID=2593642 RepID=UPI0013D75404|nr:ATP-binding protein [Desulfovibrio sp. JC022]NDV21227.1 response regulator [Desulfovibrio sp. JC022]
MDMSKEELVRELKARDKRIAELEKQLYGTDSYHEERFRKLIDHVEMVSVQGYDKNRKVVFWNTASERLYGYSREEAIGKKLEDLIIPDFMREGVINHVRNWHENGVRIPAGELELIRKDGSTVPVYSAHAMQENQDGTKYMYCIDVDLTEIKKAHSQLIQAKELAESANRAKSEFLANMSHEIRTPLNGILGMLQLLKLTPLDKEQLEYINLAVMGAKRLTTLLSDILDLSRVEAGKLSIESSPFQLNELLHNIADLYRPAAHQKKLTIKLSPHPATQCLVKGDAARLQQVLTNILGNAIKFTESGDILIETYPLPAPSPDHTKILFSITDTGPGIPDSKLDELFTPFTQGNVGFDRPHQGAGLGLTICKQLVQLMGGNIAIESELGKGTTIHFCINFGTTSSQLPQPIKADENNIHPVKMKILLAEDEIISRLAAKKQMELNGCEVTAVENGRLALEKVSAEKFHIIMMDIQMPIMDGIATTQAIRDGEAGKQNQNIPIIAMTAYAMKGDREKFIKSGMDDYLAKPIDKHDLLKILNKYRTE